MAYPTPASSIPQTHSEIEEIEMENQRSTRATSNGASSSSSAADSNNSSSDIPLFDVFINHRGEVKMTFVTRLYGRLLSHGLKPFLDQQDLQEGLPFPSQLEAVIRNASIHVAVFSPKYAYSPWCLNELVLMLQSGAPIIPVFYHVDPADLRWTDHKKTGVYALGLRHLELKKTSDSRTQQETLRYDPATIQEWRDALSSVADIHGFDLNCKFNGDEAHMIDKIVECVGKMIRKPGLYVAKHPTGLDDKVTDFEATVFKQQHAGEIQVAGIVGIGGMGKTTLALEFFNRKRSEYNKSHFLSGVRENAKSPVQLLQLQRELLKGLFGLDRHIENIHQGTQMLKESLSSSSSNFLVILDDVDHEEQVDTLLPDRGVYYSNSLILITSRDRDVLRKSGVEEISIYKLTGLPLKHSRELFCSYAFCQAYPLKGFEKLVEEFLRACQGLPLSLKVFGALLFGKNDKPVWEDTLSQVYEVPDDIEKTLRISYDALHEKEQETFLDIACFFIGEKRDMTVGIWDEPGWKLGSSRFQNLESKCLVEVDSDNYIRMHDHLRDLGREIARGKLPRRLWHPTDNVDNLLQQSCGLTEVRAIRLFFDNHSWYSCLDEVKLSWLKRGQELFDNHMMNLQNRLQNTWYRFYGIGVQQLQILETEGHFLEHILKKVHAPDLR